MTYPPSREPTIPSRKTQQRQISSTQVMFAAIIAIGLILAINFSNRIAEDRRLREVRDVVLQEIGFLETEQLALLEQLRYAASDAYVEVWAHSEGNMIRPGEILVRPVPVAADMEPMPIVPVIASVETTPPDPEPYQLWWALFFDSPPPTAD